MNRDPASEELSEQVASESAAGLLDERKIAWALGVFGDVRQDVLNELWWTIAPAIQRAMQEFLAERDLSEEFEAWLAKAKFTTEKRAHWRDEYRTRIGLPQHKPKRIPNAQAEALVAVVDLNESLREEFEQEIVAEREEATDV